MTIDSAEDYRGITNLDVHTITALTSVNNDAIDVLYGVANSKLVNKYHVRVTVGREFDLANVQNILENYFSLNGIT